MLLGLHDARNTARLAWQMIGDGCVMQITKSLQTVTDQLLIPTLCCPDFRTDLVVTYEAFSYDFLNYERNYLASTVKNWRFLLEMEQRRDVVIADF